MTMLPLLGLVILLTGGWWLSRHIWLFPSRHNHGEAKGCGRIYMLPSSWTRPFGLDKLRRSLQAEKERRLPVLSLEDHQRYGDTYGQYAGGLFTVLTRDPRNIASILTEQQSKFGYGILRSLCFGPLLGDGIFTEDGPAWAASRRLLAPGLSGPHFPALHVLESHFQDLLRTVASSLKTSPLVDVRPIIHNYTLDTATDLFLGVSTDLLSQPTDANTEGVRFSKAFGETTSWLATRERFKMFAWLVTPPSFLRSCWAARDALENIIIEAQRKEIGCATQPFTDFLGKSTDLGKARDELMNLLFAGRDSNASLLCWLIYVLAREPGVYSKLESEVFSALGDDPNTSPTDTDLRKMPYLESVVYETLRLFPAVPINGRLCSETTTLPSGGGEAGNEPIFVPKGALVCFSTFACHRSTKTYGQDAAKFRPERWREVGVKARTQDYTLHPFIGGPRKCLGENFALKFAKYTLCRLVQCFDTIDVRDCETNIGADWEERVKYHVGVTMSPNDDLVVSLRMR
ncbi:cytochrome P450 [Xylariomycetidae sp. FL2044]|nr:cytochrome P450 [Xylariomycetidae sp. FL2044]